MERRTHGCVDPTIRIAEQTRAESVEDVGERVEVLVAGVRNEVEVLGGANELVRRHCDSTDHHEADARIAQGADQTRQVGQHALPLLPGDRPDRRQLAAELVQSRESLGGRQGSVSVRAQPARLFSVLHRAIEV